MIKSIKSALILNAIKNFRLSIQAGGKGHFKIGACKFSKAGHKVSIDGMELSWDVPVGYSAFVDGKFEGSQEDYVLKFSVSGLDIKGVDGEEFQLDFIELDSILSIKEFILAMPIQELLQLDEVQSEERQKRYEEDVKASEELEDRILRMEEAFRKGMEESAFQKEEAAE